MPTRNVVPRGHNEGQIGRPEKWWYRGWFGTVFTWILTNTEVSVTVAHLEQATRDVLRSQVVAPTGLLKLVDQIEISRLASAKWYLRLDGAGKHRSMEIASYYDGADPTFTGYAIQGDKMTISFYVDIDSGYLRLLLQNDEAADLTVNFRRLAV